MDIEQIVAQCRPSVSLPEMVKALNLLYHEIEAEHYDESHDEIWEQELPIFRELVGRASQGLKGSPVSLLDYGCGTGDNVRQLIRDGFPRDRITAFDVDRASIDLGFDLYRDREEISDLFVASGKFPFGPAEFGTVYSASVFHVIADDQEFGAYLAHAWSALEPGGILFGSTLGLVEGAPRSSGGRGPPRLMTGGELNHQLTSAGFTRPEMVRRDHVPHHIAGRSDGMCFFEFCTGKPA